MENIPSHVTVTSSVVETCWTGGNETVNIEGDEKKITCWWCERKLAANWKSLNLQSRFEWSIKVFLINFRRLRREKNLIKFRLCLTTRHGISYIVAGCQTSFNKFSRHLRQEKFPTYSMKLSPKFPFFPPSSRQFNRRHLLQANLTRSESLSLQLNQFVAPSEELSYVSKNAYRRAAHEQH